MFSQAPFTETYNRKIVKGVAWNVIEVGTREGINIITRLVLARLLIPEHFGLIGMAVVITGLMNSIADLGFGPALIQRSRNDLREVHINTLFWGATFFAIILYIVIVLGFGPLASWFFNEPMVQPLIIIIALPILVKPLSVIIRSMLIKDYHFRPVVLADIISVCVGGIVGITAALIGAGVWSIALQIIATQLLIVPLLWIANPWVPSVEFSLNHFFQFLSYGKYITAINLFGFLRSNIDYLLIGKILGPAALGIYALAFFLTDIARSKTKSIFDKVFYPVYCDEKFNKKNLRKFYLATVRYNAMIVFPLMVLLILYAGFIIPRILGEQWVDAIIPIQLLSIAAMIHAVGGTSAMIFRAIGWVKENFLISFFNTFLVAIPTIIVGSLLWGIVGASLAVIIFKSSSRLICQHYMRRALGVTEKDIFFALLPVLGGVTAMLSFFSIMQITNIFSSKFYLIISIFLGICFYCMVVIGLCKKELIAFIDLFNKKNYGA